MEKIKNLAKFLFREFGPLIIFYGVNHFYGLKPAIVASVAFGGLEVLYLKLKHQKITNLLKYSIGVTFIFGILDLSLKTPVFIKYESAMGNIITGLFFALTLRPGQKPIIQETAEKRWQDKHETHELTEDVRYFLRFSTWVWTFYFFLKAIFYVWVSNRYSLEESLAIRTGVGNASLYGLMFVNIYFAKNIRALLAKAHWLPSSRAIKTQKPLETHT